MKLTWLKLLADERGFVVSSEMVLMATILIIGLITGLVTVRDQVIIELADVADAVSELNQSYSFAAISVVGVGSVAGSVFNDLRDFCDAAAGVGSQGNAAASGTCLVIEGLAASNEG